jgi:tetratricopeptide (TPR) repeat protein
MDLPTTHYDEAFVAPARTEVKAEARSTSTGESILSKISLYLILAGAFLSPLLFIPSNYAPLDVVKGFFIGFVILIAALLHTIDAIRQKSFTAPRSLLGYATLGIILSALISTFTSGNISKAFFGQGFEITSASFIFLMIITAFLVSRIVMKDREVVFKIYTAIFISFLLLALFHIVRIFAGPDFLSFGVLKAVASTIVGKWYDFAAFSAVIGFLSLLGIKFLPLRASLRRLLMVALVICGFLLFIVNSGFIWGITAITALAIGIYEFFTLAGKDGSKKFFSRISFLTVIVFIIAVVLAVWGNSIALPVVNHYQAQYGELILPWQLTLDITADTLKEVPIFGVGPNRFITEYLKFKPLVINQTPFWNAEFSGGFGYIPTFLVTQGIFGALMWIFFFIAYIRSGVRLLKRVTDPAKKFFATSSFFASIFLWLLACIYIPSHVTLFLTAIFTGIVVAMLVSEGVIAEKLVAIRQGMKLGKAIPVVLYAAAIVLIIGLGTYAQKAIAVTYFQKGVKALNTGQPADVAQAKFKKALTWDASDIYYQAISESNIVKINSLAQEIQKDSQTGAAPDQKKGDQLVSLIADALQNAKKAQAIDSTNYYNYLEEARISEIGTSLKIDNAASNARNAYAEAIKRNPYNPGLYLNLARLEASQGNLKDAEQYIGRSLQLKPNYTEAVFFLSQLQVANNQLKDAMVSTQVAIQLNPSEPLLYFQLGILAYNDKNYTLSIQALEQAVKLNKDYANAKYFLGLSYARMGRNADAITQFQDLAKSNPDNKEVAFHLEQPPGRKVSVC